MRLRAGRYLSRLALSSDACPHEPPALSRVRGRLGRAAAARLPVFRRRAVRTARGARAAVVSRPQPEPAAARGRPRGFPRLRRDDDDRRRVRSPTPVSVPLGVDRVRVGREARRAAVVRVARPELDRRRGLCRRRAGAGDAPARRARARGARLARPARAARACWSRRRSSPPSCSRARSRCGPRCWPSRAGSADAVRCAPALAPGPPIPYRAAPPARPPMQILDVPPDALAAARAPLADRARRAGPVRRRPRAQRRSSSASRASSTGSTART